MLKSIDLMYQAMLAELGQRSLDAARSADFPSDGRFRSCPHRWCSSAVAKPLASAPSTAP